MSKPATPASTKQQKRKHTPAEKAREQAYCALELADYEAAIKPARRALALSPDNAVSEALLALALRGVDKLHEALIHAEKAHELAPNDPEITFTYAMCQWFVQPDNEPLKLMKQALDRLPERFDLRVDFAGYLLQQQRFEEAEKQAEQALKQAPNNSKAQIVLKGARNRSWNVIISRPIAMPPLPVTGDDSYTYSSIAGFHLRANGFEIAMDKCSHALDIDPDNAKAKSIYCTAHYLKDHDFAALCHFFSVKMHEFSNRFIYLIIPLLILLGGSLYFYKLRNPHYYYWGLSALLYLTIYFLLQVLGEKRIGASHFAEIVRSEHLTPQGRAQHVVERRNELDEIIEGSDVVADSYDSFTEVHNQIERTCQRLTTVSNAYSAFAFLSMCLLLGTIVVQSNTAQVMRGMWPLIQKALGILTVLLVFMAFNRRNKAHRNRQRLIESKTLSVTSVPADTAKGKR